MDITPLYGPVIAYNPSKHTAFVSVNGMNIEMLVPQLAGAWYAPKIGQMAFVFEQDGNFQIKGFEFEEMPLKAIPANMTTGEWRAYGPNGSSTHLRSDGSIYITANDTETSGNLAAGTGCTGTFPTGTGQIVTVKDGIIININ